MGSGGQGGGFGPIRRHWKLLAVSRLTREHCGRQSGREQRVGSRVVHFRLECVGSHRFRPLSYCSSSDSHCRDAEEVPQLSHHGSLRTGAVFFFFFYFALVFGRRRRAGGRYLHCRDSVHSCHSQRGKRRLLFISPRVVDFNTAEKRGESRRGGGSCEAALLGPKGRHVRPHSDGVSCRYSIFEGSCKYTQ